MKPASLASSALAVLAVTLAGCVVEEKPAPRPGARRIEPAAVEPAEIPTGPITEPALDSTMSTHVRVAVTPLGEVAYDGQTLPVLSPDGRFAACQTGRAPVWDTLLAGDGGDIPLRSEITIYDLTGERARAVAPAEALPAGLVLGRAADSTGFLIESPRPDGSRWIGRIGWLSGRIEWLVRSADVCAHAIFGPGETLIYTRRPVGGVQAELAMRLPGGAERRLNSQEASYSMPVWTGDPDLIYAAEASAEGMGIVAVRAVRSGPGQEVSALGTIITRRIITASTDPVVAYQALSPAQSVASADEALPPLAFFHPAMERMVVLDSRSGRITPLAPQSIAAAPADQSGYFCTTPRGLVYWALPGALEAWSNQRTQPDPEARVLAEPYVVRRTSDAGRPMTLIGPARDALRLKLATMALAGDDNAETQ
ncbi:MAG: hypothetical protein ACF8R7_04520 [Phycisphaerales bacterium JB039]